MDFHLKQWRNQEESEQQPSAKIPKLLLDPHPQLPSASVLPLFVPEPNTKISNLSAFPDLPTTPTPTRFPRMGSFFSLAQWQELELQALIFRYMVAGAAVPAELLHPIRKSLLINNPSYYLHHHPLQHYPHYQPPALMQSGYWGRGAMDPEPGRCRRTDGKKWRCSRDVVAGHKYCERHMHRGRNRSRKPVEIPTPTIAVAGGGAGDGGGGGIIKSATPITAPPLTAVAGPGGTHFALSGPSPSINLLHINQSSSKSMNENQRIFEPQNEKNVRSDGQILRHFFDDWPRSLEESGNNGTQMTSSSSSGGGLSMSIAGNSPSDVSLKLSTGGGDEGNGNGGRERGQLNWGGGGWGTHHVAPMGGPLAEALRSSAAASNSSPTSVLHDNPRSSASYTSYVST